jgi:hypothetical protein
LLAAKVLKNRIKKPNRIRPWFLAFIALVLLAGTAGSIPVGGCASAQTIDAPSAYCYRIDITTTNNTAGVLTDHGVRAEVPAASFISIGQLQEDGMDFRPTAGGYSNEQTAWAQDLDSSAAPWWFRVDSLAAGASKTFRIYTGNTSEQRDNGIFFTGSDLVTIADHADFDITDELAIEATVQILDATPQNAQIVDKWDANQGYSLELVDVASVMYLRVRLDGGSYDVAWDSSWTDEPTKFRVEFDQAQANDVIVYANGASVGSTNLGLASITANAENIAVGSGLGSGVVHRVRISDTIAGDEVTKGRWSFTADSCTETTSSDPSFQGTCSDSSGNNHAAAYTFSRAQSGTVSVSVGSIALTSAPLLVTAADSVNDVVGSPLDSELFVSGVGLSENIRFPMGSGLSRFVDRMPFPREASWFLIFGFASCMFALLFWAFIPTTESALIGSVIPMFAAVGLQLIEPWYLSIWVLLGIAMWSAPKWARGF